jgi:hypothetical protein
MRIHMPVFQSRLYRIRNQRRPAVAAQTGWATAWLRKPFISEYYFARCHSETAVDGHSLPCELINDGQTTWPARITGLIKEKIITPDMVRTASLIHPLSFMPNTLHISCFLTTCRPSWPRIRRTRYRLNRTASPFIRLYTLL